MERHCKGQKKKARKKKVTGEERKREKQVSFNLSYCRTKQATRDEKIGHEMEKDRGERRC